MTIYLPIRDYRMFWGQFKHFYNLDETSEELKAWLHKKCARAYKERKANMKPLYKVYMSDVLKRNRIPWVLKGRKKEWQWLVRHFTDNKDIGDQMSDIRTSIVGHPNA